MLGKKPFNWGKAGWIAAGSLALLAVLGGAVSYVSTRRPPVQVTLFGPSGPQTIASRARTVGDFLKERSLTVGPHDVLVPPPETPLDDGLEVDLGVVERKVVTERKKVTLPAKTVYTDALSVGEILDVEKGLQKQSESSTLQYKQKLADQEQEWADLCGKLSDSSERLKMTITIEKIQEEKLENERVRLQQGRTTTYQVLLFEQDHLQSELSFLSAASTVLTLRAKLSVFIN